MHERQREINVRLTDEAGIVSGSERILVTSDSSTSDQELTPPLLGVILGYIGAFGLFLGALAALAGIVNLGPGLGGFFLNGLPILFAFVGLGFVTSILVFVSSSLLYNRPEEHLVWGWIILFFGLIGFGPWNFWGAYAIGSIFSIAGGFYGLAFQPHKVSVPTGVEHDGTPSSFLKSCIHCGARIPIAADMFLLREPQKPA